MFDQHVIETPENISFGYPVAGIGSRFLAALVDTLIQGALYLFVAVLLLIVNLINPTLGLPKEMTAWIPMILNIVFIVALFLIQFGYYLFFEITSGGRSPGKDLFGLRVIKENGYPLTAMDSIIRNLVRIVDFLPLFYGVGVITMFLNARAKRLGDFAAGTLVVRVGDQVKLSDLRKTDEPSSNTPALAGVENLNDADMELIESFLHRRNTLSNASALGASIVERTRARMNTPEANDYAANYQTHVFLGRVVGDYRARQSRQ